MSYKLKANAADFEVVDGPFAGRKFVAGQIYTEIPASERAQFEPVKTDSAPAKTKQQAATGQNTEVNDA
jgi:hypothetical protein